MSKQDSPVCYFLRAFARSLLSGTTWSSASAIIVLDEASSELDSTIRQEVQRSVDRHYIVIAIAYRFSTVIYADRIDTVENGRIIEHGSPHPSIRGT